MEEIQRIPLRKRCNIRSLSAALGVGKNIVHRSAEAYNILLQEQWLMSFVRLLTLLLLSPWLLCLTRNLLMILYNLMILDTLTRNQLMRSILTRLDNLMIVNNLTVILNVQILIFVSILKWVVTVSNGAIKYMAIRLPNRNTKKEPLLLLLILTRIPSSIYTKPVFLLHSTKVCYNTLAKLMFTVLTTHWRLLLQPT